MISEKSKSISDACRFCWMCRHVCPVGLQTGKEVNNARGKGLLVSMVNRGATFDESMAKVMWECILCSSCSNNCVTGYEPPVFIREMRTKAIVEDLAPNEIKEIFTKVLDTGNIYGADASKKFDLIKNDLNGLPQKASTLLYIGEVAAIKTPNIAKAIIRLLRKAGIEFTCLIDEPSSGAYLGDLVGFVEEVRKIGEELSQAINNSGTDTVIVIDPLDARIMKHEYAEWNISADAKIITATSYFLELIERGKLKPVEINEVVTFHDTGALCRDLNETQPARDLITSMGLTLKEMFLNRDLARSSGGALYPLYEPDIASMLAKARWDDAGRTDAKILVTESPGSYYALLSEVPDGMKLLDIYELLDHACN